MHRELHESRSILQLLVLFNTLHLRWIRFSSRGTFFCGKCEERTFCCFREKSKNCSRSHQNRGQMRKTRWRNANRTIRITQSRMFSYRDGDDSRSGQNGLRNPATWLHHELHPPRTVQPLCWHKTRCRVRWNSKVHGKMSEPKASAIQTKHPENCIQRSLGWGYERSH